MSTNDIRSPQRRLHRLVVAVLLAVMFINIFPTSASAANNKTDVVGKIFEFDKDSHYEFSSADTYNETNTTNTYGTFSISGNVAGSSLKNGIPSYEVADGNLAFYYNYTDSLLNADEDSWHLIDDKSKKINDLTLSENIMKGAIIIQTSKDQKTWIDVSSTVNAFSNTPIRTSSIYTTTDVQLINGCYYRIIVAYELRIRTENSNFLFINTDKHESKKCVEVYEFYAYTDSGETNVTDPNQTHNLGKRVRVKNFDGYFGEETINKDDVHYGWDLGNFFVSGYTDDVTDTEGNKVFLKNVGDKVTLWFNLNENINGLRGNDDLSITADADGYDQYFETPKMNFGRGVLIIRYTDHNDNKSEPTIYTNYLEANATVGADTKVQLFEEGDYEVALDYEITHDQLIDTVGHYRIFFKFSVRNGNCMVYPFDVITGSELSNSSMTANGFRLDLAKSRYLKVNVKREILKDSADGLVEDTRFNGPAKDGAEYVDEGIYTITVHNEYTNQFTVKKIYVGTNNVLRAHMTTGLSIPEINELVEQGATISDDGIISLSTVVPEVPETQDTPDSSSDSVPEQPSDSLPLPGNDDISNKEFVLPIVFGAIIIVLIITAATILGVRSKRRKAESRDVNGGTEE